MLHDLTLPEPEVRLLSRQGDFGVASKGAIQLQGQDYPETHADANTSIQPDTPKAQ